MYGLDGKTALKLRLNVTLLSELKLSPCPPAADASSAGGSGFLFGGTQPELGCPEHQAAVGRHRGETERGWVRSGAGKGGRGLGVPDRFFPVGRISNTPGLSFNQDNLVLQ